MIISKPRVLFATNNAGKVTEAKVFAKNSGVELLTPKDLGLKLDVDETGTSYAENAFLKAKAFYEAVKDTGIIVVGDDSGIEIPALNNEPGIHSRRWKGYPMTDQEILDYCVERMQGIKGADRNARFVATLAVLIDGEPVQYFTGEMQGHINEQPVDGEIIEGFPFRSVMYIPEIKKMIYEIHGTTIAERGGFMTHREKALQTAFDWIAEQSKT